MRQRFSILKPLLFMSSLFFSLPTFTPAQAGNGEITGEVRDASQGIIASAKITLTEQGTNLLYESATNEDGIYQWSALKPGRYPLTVEKDGFQRYDREDITIRTGERIRVNVT